MISCHLETIEQTNNQIFEEDIVTHYLTSFSVFESDNLTNEFQEDHCHSVSLVAGQHHEAGTVAIDVDGDALKVTYNTTDDWV